MCLPAIVLSLLFATGGAVAQTCATSTLGGLTVESAWSRATIGADRPGALYLVIRNEGGEEDALVGLATPAAAMPMLHETVVADGTARMPHVAAVPVPAGGTAALEPGGFHGMLMGLSAPLEAGASFPVTLVFEKAGEITIDVDVLPPASTGPAC